MKKNYLLTMIICLLSFNIMAQTTITYNGNAPQVGDIYNVSGASGSFDPGTAGANQNWDFSSINPSVSWEINVIDPVSTPFVSEFPEANLAYYYNNSSPESYTYVQLNSTELLNNGNASDPGANELSIHYTDAVKLLQYPFSFSDTFTDTYYTEYTSFGDAITHEWGNITATADAWGNVITPAGTYENTLRIKREMVYVDSMWVSGVFLYATTLTTTDYDWYTESSHHPILSISVTNSGTSISYSSSVGGIEKNQSQPQINIFPNPANDFVNITLSNINTDITEINIVNVLGQQLSNVERTGNHQFSSDISRLSPGVYFIRINGERGNYIYKKFIKY